MSAFIVSKGHIDAMVCSGLSASRYDKLRWRQSRDNRELSELSRETADKVGAMLWAENVRSVEYRYDSVPAGELPGSYQLELVTEGVEPIEVPEWWSEYRYTPRQVKPIEALKLIDCYEYQSCEHAEWEESEAFAFCDSLRRSLIGNLPGYNDGPWGLR